jgi:prolyl-tRNA editing enzyme YbaK/EbsC (Cys-tRNA(Pro) deacylase)
MKADTYLDEQEFNYTEVVQDKPTKSCDDAAKERGLQTHQIVKSLIIESEDQKYHILLPGDRTLSESKFGAEYRMVPPEESKELTGFESGTVHPFSTELKHVVDERIFENKEVSHTVGETQRGLIIDADNFRKALEEAEFPVEVRDIAVSTESDYEELEEKDLDEKQAKFVVKNGNRKAYLALENDYSNSDIITLFKEFGRHELKVDTQLADKILDRAENQTHIQRLVESYSEEGELPDQEDFNLEEQVEQVIGDNPDAVEDYQDGQDSAVNYLIGQLMQQTNGRADAGKARELVLEDLE